MTTAMTRMMAMAMAMMKTKTMTKTMRLGLGLHTDRDLHTQCQQLLDPAVLQSAHRQERRYTGPRRLRVRVRVNVRG
jgi:hypothetical protein